MSYILEALKKSEQERDQAAREQQGAAQAALAYGHPEIAKGRSYGVLILIVLLVNVGLVWHVFFNNGSENQQVATNEVVNQTKPVAKKIANPKPKPKTILRNNKIASKNPVKKTIVRPKKATPKPLQRIANPVKTADAKSKVTVKPVVKTVLQEQQEKLIASVDSKPKKTMVKPAKKIRRLPPEIDPTPVKKKSVVKKVAKPKGLKRTKVGIKGTVKSVAKPKPKPRSRPKVIFSKVELDASSDDVPVGSKNIQPRQVAAKTPHFDKMKPEFRRQFPKIDINVHVYDNAPDDRFVLIEMKRYVEGDTLPGGITIKEITPEGFVLYYKKKTFLYPAK